MWKVIYKERRLVGSLDAEKVNNQKLVDKMVELLVRQ